MKTGNLWSSAVELSLQKDSFCLLIHLNWYSRWNYSPRRNTFNAEDVKSSTIFSSVQEIFLIIRWSLLSFHNLHGTKLITTSHVFIERKIANKIVAWASPTQRVRVITRRGGGCEWVGGYEWVGGHGEGGHGGEHGKVERKGEGRERIFTNVSHPTANNMDILVRRWTCTRRKGVSLRHSFTSLNCS